MSKKYPARHVLFVCSANQNRSRAAERILRDIAEHTPDLEYDVEVRSAGTNPRDDGVELTEELVDWADGIYVFEGWQERLIEGQYPAAKNKVCNLQIPDIYERDDPDLELILRHKLPGTL